MDTFMEIPVYFFVFVMVFIGLPYLFLRHVFPGNWTRDPKPASAGSQRYYCKGSVFSGTPYPRSEGAHTHKTYAEAGACGQRWLAAEEAKARHQGPATPCPVCHRNHFSSMCPGLYKAQVMADGSARYISKETGEIHEVARPQ
jgi:hypothetical protein